MYFLFKYNRNRNAIFSNSWRLFPTTRPYISAERFRNTSCPDGVRSGTKFRSDDRIVLSSDQICYRPNLWNKHDVYFTAYWHGWKKKKMKNNTTNTTDKTNKHTRTVTEDQRYSSVLIMCTYITTVVHTWVQYKLLGRRFKKSISERRNSPSSNKFSRPRSEK